MRVKINFDNVQEQLNEKPNEALEKWMNEHGWELKTTLDFFPDDLTETTLAVEDGMYIVVEIVDKSMNMDVFSPAESELTLWVKLTDFSLDTLERHSFQPSSKQDNTEPKDAFIYPRLTERLALARNPETSPEILTKIIDDIEENQFIKTLIEIARNPNTHPADLMRLTVLDKNIIFRTNLAKNPSTPECALRELVNDWRPNIRACVARNVNTPVDVLTLLAEKDNNILVRNALEENPNIPADILVKLKKEKNQ